jgi:type III pantothenate kinase
VVDFGTALTFSTVDDAGKVIGINIVPGIKTAINSLFSRTAKLPKVQLEMPASILGKTTVHSIQAGIFYGYTALVKGMLASNCSYKIAATGGLSAVMDHLNDQFDLVDIHLTLKGIHQITSLNS